ncbi:hypothetical protein FIV42_11970 [Persicimonas caeni]|uniref:Uncharacterized protein n=1 Tax=Persicimonas caeni TaxID=2292766 RepID=A0A4Y6PT74_PERCE|nr:hypothetical protein [Persicimonas caeni]QDG51433.1 hypothetical protein FIV42_11970 [Persicimonas caeni]QED32654.1 hypothetical protein FRD00_11965 [Persicimonas caeni]
MTDDRLDQLSQVEDAETTLRDRPPADEPIELSASDLIALDADEPEEEATLVIERSQVEGADATRDDLRNTTTNEAIDAMTTERSIPQELLDQSLRTAERQRPLLQARSDEADGEEGAKTLKFEAISGPKTEKMQAVGTQPLPAVEDDPEATAVRSTDSGAWAEVDEEGFFTFMVRPDAEGRVTLPKALFAGRDPAEGVMVYVRAKNLTVDLAADE